MKQAENCSARQVTLHLTLPILVTLSPPKQPGRETFVEFVRQHADVWWEPPPVAKQNVPHQCKLDFGRG